jgi:ribosomal protein L7/L12
VGIPWRTFEEIENRLSELERLVSGLYEHAGLEPPPPPDKSRPSDRVMELLAAGKKLEAIEQLRADSGISLAEAKKIVDQFGPTAGT